MPHLHPGIDDVILLFDGINIFTVIFMVSCYYDDRWGEEFFCEIDSLEKEKKKNTHTHTHINVEIMPTLNIKTGIEVKEIFAVVK